MTEKQKQLATENHNLIYWYIHKKNLNVDVWYDIFAIALCKAVMGYDDSKNNKFSSYAVAVMENEYNMECRKSIAKRRTCDKLVSLDEAVQSNDTSTGKNTTRHEYITNGLTAWDEVIPYNISELLNQRQLLVVKFRLLGYTQCEIADRLKCSQPQINRLLQQIRTKLKEG